MFYAKISSKVENYGISKDEIKSMKEKTKQKIRIWAMLCHVCALTWIPLAWTIFLIPLYIPFLSIFGPLLVWRFKKSQHPWIDFQGREALNFQLSIAVYTLIVIVISLILFFISVGVIVLTNNIGYHVKIILNSLLIVLVSVNFGMLLLQLTLVPCAGIRAYKGEHYRYPLTIRFLK
jgi:uncharacterized protein